MLTIIGAINIDVIATTSCVYRPCDSNPACITLAVGGVAMNYAHNLSRMSQQVRFLTVFADDALGQMAQHECQRLGIDTSLATIIPHSRANMFVGIHNQQGELESAACDAELTEQHLTPDLLAQHLEAINASSLVMADTNLSANTLAWLMDHCTAPLMLDGVSVAKTQRLAEAIRLAQHPHLHTLKLNEKEYEHFLTLLSDTDWSPMIDNLLVTRGAKGVEYISSNPSIHHSINPSFHHSINPSIHHSFPALPVSHIVSTLGAGDAFLSGWAYAFLHHYPLAKAIHYAQQMAVNTLSAAGSVS